MLIDFVFRFGPVYWPVDPIMTEGVGGWVAGRVGRGVGGFAPPKNPPYFGMDFFKAIFPHKPPIGTTNDCNRWN